MSQHSLSDLSARFGLELRGDGAHRVAGVGTLAGADSSQVSFLANSAYRRQLAATQAGAVVLRPADADACPTNCLVAEDPYLAYARLAGLFDPRPVAPPGVHPTAFVSESASLGSGVSIGAHVAIGDDCRIGDGCAIAAGCVLEPGCTLGPGCRLHANVSLGHGVTLGARVIVHMGAVIGADGFGIAFAGDHWEKVPQLGSVEIGDDCEIGANTCIDRGAIENTVLEDDVRIDNLCQVGHNVRIGAHTAVAGNVGISGSTRIGRYCLLGGAAGVAGHLEIADRTTISAMSAVMNSITEPGQTWSGLFHAQPIRDWQRNQVRLRRLEKLTQRLQRIEKLMGNLSDDE